MGKLKSHFVICISRGKVDERREFSLAELLKLVVRRTISFYNEEDGILPERVLHKSQSMFCKAE